ncbi:dihydrolipoamide acetyltransferase family protein [Kocuria palustris]|uniref:dihydrolipoamide acetyltransferase family protein n=1 Tax=Kocuria palustris TaxID=71999 RepID=UPI0011A971D8|nr:dihydrolipoamide acetyltransferase family protein [Kocuria palustris]
MTRTFMLPDLGEGLTEADLIRWTVAEGDRVEIDQVVAEVETAKSAVEVPCPWAGTVVTLHGRPGEVLAVDAPLITVDTGEGPSEPDGSADAAAGQEHAQSYREEERAGAVPSESEDPAQEGSGNVLIGYGTSASSGSRRRRGRRTAADAAQRGAASAQQAHDALNEAPRLAPKVTSPLVRRLAREHGVEIGSLQGSGDGGLIMRRDVLAAIEAAAPAGAGAASAPPPAAPAGDAAGSAAQPATGDHDDRTGLRVAERTPLAGIRRTIAQAMVASRTEIPEATVWVDVDVTELMSLRERLKAKRGAAPGLMAFAARSALAGLRRHPELNVRVDDSGGRQEIVRFDGVNLGFAAQTDRGLVVPVVRDAHLLDAEGLQRSFRSLTEAVRSGSNDPSEISGSTFTINNYGVFGTDGATPIINHPEAAILGMGRVIAKPWVVDGELAVRQVMVLTLAFDHRVCDGGTAGGFLRFVADCLEDPEAALIGF